MEKNGRKEKGTEQMGGETKAQRTSEGQPAVQFTPANPKS